MCKDIIWVIMEQEILHLFGPYSVAGITPRDVSSVIFHIAHLLPPFLCHISIPIGEKDKTKIS